VETQELTRYEPSGAERAWAEAERRIQAR
ncbi:MAG: hypothetical protein QOF00_5556, partial [Pseudonocardiales bacterium]|nr:hypothetical protein [Pseudonocardiales bacterium]